VGIVEAMAATMRAAVYHGPGDVRIEDVARPRAAPAGQLLMRVLRAAICGTDAGEYSHGPKLVPLDHPHPHSGHSGPLVLGHEFAGEIVAVGQGVSGFRVGDRVVTGAGVSCGRCPRCREGRTNLCEAYFTVGLHVDGGLAEYAVTPAAICCTVPDGCSAEAAALSQPLAVGLHALRRGRVQREDALAVIGVGGIGAMVIAGAHARGVGTIVGVDIDPARLASALELGATHAVLADGEELAQIQAIAGHGGLDAVIEATGAPKSPALALSALRPGGRAVIVGLQARPTELDLFALTMNEIEVIGALAHVFAEDLPEALDILARTDLAQRSIDRVIALDDLVDAGLRPLAEGRVRGKVVIDPQPA
jgi:(R,R)-butanediol dehydrogenase / meso-butanediol dehydrogenase / diacetyl reductase